MSNETSACLRTWEDGTWLTVRAQPTSQLTGWFASLLHDEVAALDVCASRFRADSQLWAESEPGAWTEVSWDFVAVLTASLNAAAAATDGIVDHSWAGRSSPPDTTPGPARSRESGPRLQMLAGSRSRSGPDAQAQVRIPGQRSGPRRGGQGTARRQTGHHRPQVDRLRRDREHGWRPACRESEPPVVVERPRCAGVQDTAMEIIDAGLATSGLGHRSRDRHHIIDPRTAQPARTPWESVSVLAAEGRGRQRRSHRRPDSRRAWTGLACGQRDFDGWFVARNHEQAGSVAATGASLRVGCHAWCTF